MDDCIFCKIVRGDIPCHKVYENENFLAFLDISNFTEGHTLVIPKKHYRYVWDVDDMTGYFETINKIANHYRKNLGFEYVDSLVFGRMVPHAHVHLVPHNNNVVDWEKALDEIGGMQEDQQRRISKEVGEKIAEKFKMD